MTNDMLTYYTQRTANLDDFGIADMHGIEFVRGDWLRDFLAFNKVEILPWDWGWGYLGDLAPGQVEPVYARMDGVAALTLADDFAAIRARYEKGKNFHPPVARNESGE